MRLNGFITMNSIGFNYLAIGSNAGYFHVHHQGCCNKCVDLDIICGTARDKGMDVSHSLVYRDKNINIKMFFLYLFQRAILSPVCTKECK